ncbi:flagellin N-terminal helical domain-containing protein [Massilia sp. SYSU DXS3249]
MLSLHTNAASLSAQNSIGRTQNSLSTSMTRLSTGFRINSAMDDAAGLQIATRLKAQTSGMAVAMRNTQNSISMLQTAEGALNEVTNIMTRMKDLATQSADGSSSDADRTAMEAEFTSLSEELVNIMDNTKFGGEALLAADGKLSEPITFQIGSDAAEQMEADFTELDAVTTAVGAPGTVATNTGATAAITTLTTAIESVSALRSKIGAVSNRLDHVYNNLSNISTNTKNATGRIMDVDFATESANMTSKNMLMQAGTAMLKQTNQMSSMVMSLLQ